eukprot:gene9274-1361_t
MTEEKLKHDSCITVSLLNEKIDVPLTEIITLDSLLDLFKLRSLRECYSFTGLQDSKNEEEIILFESLESIPSSKLTKNYFYNLVYKDEASVKYYMNNDLRYKRKEDKNELPFDEKYIKKCYLEKVVKKHSNSSSNSGTPVKGTSKTSVPTKERKKFKFEYSPSVFRGNQEDYDENNFSQFMLHGTVEMRYGNCDMFPTVTPISCIQGLKYDLKHTGYCTFKRPNEHGTKVLANEIKEKKFQSLLKDHFNVEILEKLKAKKKLKDDDEIIINTKKGFLTFKNNSFDLDQQNPTIFIFDSTDNSDDKFYLQYEKKNINFSLKGVFVLSNKSSSTTKYMLVNKKIKIFFNKKEYYLSEELKFDSDETKALEVNIYGIDKIIDQITSNSKLVSEQVELDAGHLIPGNFGGFIAQFHHDSKIVHIGCPQLSHVNRGIWGAVESREKELVSKYKYVKVRKFMFDYYWVCIYDYTDDQHDVTETFIVPNWNKDVYSKISENKVTLCSEETLKDVPQVLNFLNKKEIIEKLIAIKF